ncbi:MAG: TetR/AcrR family transcriptional regulator [Candidatus Promineifilaceae bacterium]
MQIPTPSRKKSRQDDVYEAAARLFAEKGYHATRIQDIADELGMLKGSLYYYFNSKEDLLIKITEGHIGRIYHAIKAIVETGYPSRQKLMLAIDEHLRMFLEHVHVYTIFARENLEGIDPKLAQLVRDMNRTYQELWMQILQEGIDSGEFRPDLNPHLMMRAILAMCNYTSAWYQPSGDISVRELARQFANLIMAGVQI